MRPLEAVSSSRALTWTGGLVAGLMAMSGCFGWELIVRLRCPIKLRRPERGSRGRGFLMSSFPPSQSKEGCSCWKKGGKEWRCGISKVAVYQKMLAVSSSRVVTGWCRERSTIAQVLSFYSTEFRRNNPSADSSSNHPRQSRNMDSCRILPGIAMY